MREDDEPAASQARGESHTLGAGIARATHALIADVDRARGVLGDAVERLFAAFTSMRALIDQQRALLGAVKALLVHLPEIGGADGLADQSDERGVEAILRRAGEIERLAEKVRSLSVAASQLTEGDQKPHVGGLPQETRRLAILSAEITERVRTELASFRSTLATFATGDASPAAADPGVSLASSRASLASAAAQLAQVNQFLADTVPHVDGTASSAVQAFQFEDLLSQMLSVISRKILALSSIAGEALMLAEIGHDRARVAELAQRLAEVEVVGSVAQTSMKTGPVDLF